MSFEGKNLYGQYIDYSEKKKLAQGLHLPLYWNYFLYHSYIQQISGELLQDHWSSLLLIFFSNILTQNIDCGYTLRQGGSNVYPQSMFWIKSKKKLYTPVYPSFTI